MTVNEQLIAALKPVGLALAPNVYTGEADRYITFNYNELPANFADDTPMWYRALIQVHLFMPLGVNSIPYRRKIIGQLSAGGFTWPEVVDATDEDGQHYVFETEIYTDLEENDNA